MIRKTHLAGLLILGAATLSPLQVNADLPKQTITQYANELGQAFPGQVNIYLVGKDFESGKPAFDGVRIIGCSQVAGVLYYVIRTSKGNDAFIPQSQILVIHNWK